MKNKIKIILFPLIGFIIVLTTVLFILMCYTQNNDSIMKFAIYHTGSTSGTYYFTLDKNGVLKVEFGTRKKYEIKSIKQSNFMEEIRDSAEKTLTEKELQTLMDLANEVDFLNYDLKKHIVFGGNYIVFLYKGRIHEAHHSVDTDSIAFTNLIDIFIELSPLPIKLNPFAE